MKETWTIAQWEIMRNLRNKQFIIGLLITPLIMAAFAGIPRLLSRWNQPTMLTYYVADTMNLLDPEIKNAIPNVELVPFAGDVGLLPELVQAEDVDGYFVIDPTFLASGTVELHYQKRNREAEAYLNALFSSVLQSARMHKAHLDPDTLAHVTAAAVINGVPLAESGDQQSQQVVAAFAFVGLLLFLIFSSGSMLLYSALQERRDRMAEVILSSISPAILMQGKILGHFILGVLQLGFWLLLGLPIVIFFLDFPVSDALAHSNLPVMLFFGLLGYLLYGALYVSMGATLEDLASAGNSQGTVIMLPMLPVLFFAPVAQNPDGIIAQVVSFFPLTSPIMMILRSSLTDVPTIQILTSSLLLLLTAFLVIRLAAKIFRIGMLMYGKNADLAEMVKWARHKDA